jgi:hypothetical protein
MRSLDVPDSRLAPRHRFDGVAALGSLPLRSRALDSRSTDRAIRARG